MNNPPYKKESDEPPDPELLIQLLRNQAQEIAIRQQELALENRRIANDHELTQKSIEAQVGDRDKQRQFDQTARRDRLIFSGGMALLLVAFVFYALYLNKDQIVIEVLKALIFLAAGGLGGYSLKKARDKNGRDDE